MINYGFGKISLGTISEHSLEKLRVNRNDWHIRRWCRQRGLIDDYQQKKWFREQSDDPTIHMFSVNVEHVGMVGVCGLTDIDPMNRRAEFSLYIFPGHHGKGYGKPALQTLCSYGFFELGLWLIWGETVGDNPAMKTFQAVGFKRTGHRPDFYFKNGKFHTSYIYCLKDNEWRSEHSPLPE